MISHGPRILDVLGNKKNNKWESLSQMSISFTPMNSWELRRDSVLLHLLIDAISHYHKLLVCFMVVLQLDQPELVRQRQ
jgi:hypothetical protein